MRLNPPICREICRVRLLSHCPLSILSDTVVVTISPHMGAVSWEFIEFNSPYLALREKIFYHVVLEPTCLVHRKYSVVFIFYNCIKNYQRFSTPNNTNIFSQFLTASDPAWLNRVLCSEPHKVAVKISARNCPQQIKVAPKFLPHRPPHNIQFSSSRPAGISLRPLNSPPKGTLD